MEASAAGSPGSIRILGIDPGLSALGYGIVDSVRGKPVYVASGTITTSASSPYGERLDHLYSRISELIVQHRATVLAMERPIYCQNVRTALALGQAGGMAILAAVRNGLDLHEFTPAEVKQAIVGKGRASKDQVQKMVRILLSLGELPESSHAADALACSICYVHSEKRLRLLAEARVAAGRPRRAPQGTI